MGCRYFENSPLPTPSDSFNKAVKLDRPRACCGLPATHGLEDLTIAGHLIFADSCHPGIDETLILSLGVWRMSRWNGQLCRFAVCFPPHFMVQSRGR